jgi:hypothetical protein
MAETRLERILRDLESLSIEEKRQIFRLLGSALGANGAAETAPTRAPQQREALLALHAEVVRLPVTNPSDGLSNRDHDQILYGEVS